MNPFGLATLIVAMTACSGTTAATPTVAVTSTSVAVATSTTTAEMVTECPPAPYQLSFLPAGIGEGTLDPETLEPDVWTSVAGSNTTFFPRDDGSAAVALIRGTLPAVDWPGEKGEASIDGTRAAVGPHRDGTWVAGWFEAPGERCDLYTMVFYPPWSPADVEQVLTGMNRVGG
ncbi:MAG: hypothetical protein KY394_01560 [Actinobacteria bacterium]|nr:hypothetical protein [Actinomycetota bacterium]